MLTAVSSTHLVAHATNSYLLCRLVLKKKKKNTHQNSFPLAQSTKKEKKTVVNEEKKTPLKKKPDFKIRLFQLTNPPLKIRVYPKAEHKPPPRQRF